MLPAILALFLMMGTVPVQASEAAIPAYVARDLTGMAALVEPGTTLETTADGLIVLFDLMKDGPHLKYLDADGTTVKSIPVNVPGNLAAFCFDSNGTIQALVISEVASKSSKTQTTMARSVMALAPDGKPLKTVSLGEVTFTTGDPWYALDIAVDAKGTMYLATRRGIEVFDPRGRPGRQLASYNCISLALDRAGMLYSAGYSMTDYQSLLEKIDPASGKQAWRIDLGDMPMSMNLDRTLNLLTVIDGRYITRYTTDGKLEGRLFEMKSTALSGNALYNSSFLATAAGDVYVIKRSPGATGDDPWTRELFRYTRSTQTAQPKNVLTISHGYWYDRYPDAAISAFERANPGWKVQILKTIEQKDMETGDVYDQVLTSVATELMAGRGADIISLAFLPYRSFIDKGLLVDLDQMAAGDKSFDISVFRKNVLDAFRYKGALHSFPANFTTQILFANKKVLDMAKLQIDDSRWTWSEFFDVCDKVRKDLDGDGVPDRFALPSMEARSLFFSYIRGSIFDEFCDAEKKTARFTDPRFARLLEETKQFAERNALKNPVTMENWLDSARKGSVVFFLNYLTGPLDPQTFGDLLGGEARLLSLPGPSVLGQGTYSSLIFGLNKRSKHVEPAWEMLKLLVAEDIQQGNNLFGFPINNRAFTKWIQTIKTATAKGQMMGGFQGSPITYKPLSDSDVKLVEGFVSRIGRDQYMDHSLQEIVGQELKDFWAGKRTADAVCASLQEKVMTYLRE